MTTIAALSGVASVNLSDLLPIDQSPSGTLATKHASITQLWNSLPVATTSTAGIIQVGSGLTMTGNVLSANATSNYVLPTATTSVLGGVKVDGTTIVINGSGVISSTGGGGSGYVLPAASAATLGGVSVPLTNGLSLSVGGALTLTPATTTTIGGIVVSTGLNVSGSNVGVTYGTAAGTSTQGNDTRVVNAAQLSGAAFTGAVTFGGVAAATQTFVTSQNYITAATIPVANSTTLGGVKPDGTSLTNNAGALSVTYGSTANSAIQGNVLATLATLAAPAFTGVATFASIPTCSATMPASNTTTNQIPTMAWVQTAVVAGTAGVSSLVLTNGTQTGSISLATLVAGGLAPIANPTHTGTLTSSTANVLGGTNTITGTTNISGTTTIATGLTVSGNPTFSGAPLITSTMPASNTSSTQIPTMAWVQTAVVGGTSGVSSLVLTNGVNTGSISLATLVTGGIAPLASPTFTGTVTIPAGASISGYLTAATAASTYATSLNANLTGVPTGPAAIPALGASSTQLATAAFVHQEVTNTVSGSVNNGNGTAGIAFVDAVGNLSIQNAYPMPIYTAQQVVAGQVYAFFAPSNVRMTGVYFSMTSVSTPGITVTAQITINGTVAPISSVSPSGPLSITTASPGIVSLLTTPTTCAAGQVITATITSLTGTWPTTGLGTLIIQFFATYA